MTTLQYYINKHIFELESEKRQIEERINRYKDIRDSMPEKNRRAETHGTIRVNSQSKNAGSKCILIEIEGTPEYVAEKYSMVSARINHGKL